MSVFRLKSGKKALAVLLDPDKLSEDRLLHHAEFLGKYAPDLILVGGSLLFKDISETVELLKSNVRLPIYLFPGDVSQLSENADGIFFLSLISGRNPEYLIGTQVISAPKLKRSGMDVLPTAYMLIDGGKTTSVEYMSNTRPIPSDKSDIAVATALAGELLGMKQVYLEAGSGAKRHVPLEMIGEVKKALNIPLIVGGGIRTYDDCMAVYEAGADLIVVGNVLEKDPSLLKDFMKARDRF